jgi:hypothetical protein
MDGFSLDFVYDSLAPALVFRFFARIVCNTRVCSLLGQIVAGLLCMATAYFVSSLLSSILGQKT